MLKSNHLEYGISLDHALYNGLYPRRFDKHLNAAEADGQPVFFRDNTGNEIDPICDPGQKTDAVEIKSAQTVASDFLKGLRFFPELSGNVRRSMVIYGGDAGYVRENFQVTGWRDIGTALK